MRNRVKNLVSGALISLLVASCASLSKQPEPAFTPVNLNTKIKSGEYQKKVDNFLLIFDASSSMFLDHNHEMKFKQAKRIANRLNQTIPDLDIQAGLRIFGPIDLKSDSKLSYGMTNYAETAFANALSDVTSPAGGTPLSKSIKVATKNLTDSSGKIALILISDGEDVNSTDSVNAAAALKKTYSDRICIYTIHIGDNPLGKKTMEQIANASQCGFATDYAAIESPQGMAAFVERIFLDKARLLDSDGDGVFDNRDKCPGTPTGITVDNSGCPVKMMERDSDSDGVYDSKDQCLGTPHGIKVDEYGCPLPIKGSVTIELRVEFDYNKDLIRRQYRQELQNFANFMTTNPNSTVTLEGHTDNYGSKNYNEGLALRRAKSVRRYLVSNFNIWGNRITAKGYGESHPEASNKTSQGRQKNRRVYATITSN